MAVVAEHDCHVVGEMTVVIVIVDGNDDDDG